MAKSPISKEKLSVIDAKTVYLVCKNKLPTATMLSVTINKS